MRQSIASQYIHILLSMIAAFTIFYFSLFVVNRIQYINDELALKEKEISHNISRTVSIAESINIRQVRYFIDSAKLLEYIYKNDKKRLLEFLRKTAIYDFIGIMDNNGKFIYASNPNLAKILTFKPHNKIATIKSTILYDTNMLTTYRILSYPIATNGRIEAYIVGFLDVSSFIDISDIYLISQDSVVLNSSDINSIYLGNKTFAFLYPQAWDMIQKSNEGQFRTDDALFTYKLLIPEKKIADFTIQTGDMYFLSSFPINKDDSPYFINSVKSFIKYSNFNERIFYWILGYIWILFASVILYILIVNRIKNNLLVNTDQLTGAYNRRKGFQLLEKLTRIYSISRKGVLNRFFIHSIFLRRFLHTIHICLVDIDNLKQTNDKLGHKFGDELISITINTIKSYIKRDEMIIRIGGDEFLIVFINRKMEDIDRIWQQIQSDFDNKNTKGKFPYTISISKGVIEYRNGANIQDCIIEADALMYREKKRRKINLFFD